MTDLILSLAWIALVVLAVCTLAYGIYTVVPKAIDFVKSFFKWHFFDDDDWM